MKSHTESCTRINDNSPREICTCEEDKAAAKTRKNAARRARHAILTDLGLCRVRGNLGGVYYE